MDLGDDFLEPAHRAFAHADNLNLPALLRREPLVHAEQIAGKQRRFVAAGAGADFENDVALIHCVLGNERKPQPLFEHRAARFEIGLFLFGDGAHLGVRRRIGNQAGKSVEFPLRGPVGVHRFDDRRQFGEFARQLYVSLRRLHAGEIAFHRRMTHNKRIEFLVGKHRRCPSSCPHERSSGHRHDRRSTSARRLLKSPTFANDEFVILPACKDIRKSR